LGNPVPIEREMMSYPFQTIQISVRCQAKFQNCEISDFTPCAHAPEVHRIRISVLESGRKQHILNKPNWNQTTVLFKFPDQDSQIYFVGVWRQHNRKKNFCKDFKDMM